MILSFKKMAIYSVVVIAASAMVTLGLKTLTYSEVSNPLEVETMYGPIKLTMRLGNTTYKLGELVKITLTITNIGNETVLLGFCTPCKTNFVVSNKLSQTIYNYYSSCGWLTFPSEITLDSGESFGQTLKWKQLEKDKFPPFASRQVQPGTYYIKGQMGPHLRYVGPAEEYDPLRGGTIINVETQKIQTEIA